MLHSKTIVLGACLLVAANSYADDNKSLSNQSITKKSDLTKPSTKQSSNKQSKQRLISYPSFKYVTYIGLDFGVADTKYKAGFGDNLFARRQFFVSPFVGMWLDKYYGIEGGFEQTRTKERDTSLHSGDVNLGTVTGGIGNYGQYSNKSKYRTIYLSVNGRAPLYGNSYSNQAFFLTGGIGLALVKVNLKRVMYEYNGGAITPSALFLNSDNSKIVPRLSAGMEYKLNKSFSVRTNAVFLNTSKVKPTGTVITGVVRTAKLKNSMRYSLGVTYSCN